MIRRTISELAVMAGAELANTNTNAGVKAGQLIEGVMTDTRAAKPGSLFVPIRGERFDGHDFVQDAVNNGAAAALWCRDVVIPDGLTIPLLLVDDTLTAIQQLSAAYRSQLKTKVIGITGSNGKTSTKDILAGLLATTYKTQKTPGNFNNHLGVPLTLLQLEEDTEMAVVEMGMSDLGEIAMLSRLAQPDAAIITSISEVHLGDLHTRERIIEAKLEIMQGLQPGSPLIYNADNPQFVRALGANPLIDELKLVPFGSEAGHAYYPTGYVTNETGTTFTISDRACPVLFTPLLGRHQMLNALGAIAAARYCGVTYENIRQGLREAAVTGMRNEQIRLGSSLVINDAYKSNPASLRAALDMLYCVHPDKKKIAVIGNMVELGEEAAELHRGIGSELQMEQIDLLVTIGEMAAELGAAARIRYPQAAVLHCADKAAITELLREQLREPSVVLIKGSRALQLEEIITALRTEESVAS
ncbi:UDP-N-acetylmuramoyl-tripeptide--D-alanyl-D-alanine ligase [Paenibacillus tarimensis]|uniref:UDP-N-acetylmuramoyl-tripeptide--D-alanyl-D- alanine ligase n=1 Tax=Paenibacillus tarimensis TaxID=416012 RepID=UPI001F32FF4B|nr:UDP-N-acetylmuramoyl-tripeptide--D-alanyl-D-alanine ligase [Paenibacillus tarimensis]MCF2945301.1 UDP-N-acetylmuramoyl-tripeptide--D-alanyl-D-alanine ligase [Paenibacillus tarimensis]